VRPQKIQGDASAPDEAQACTKFLDADSMIRTKADLVSAGFSNLEDVYREVRQAQQALIAETLAVTNRK
jgi:hypothetical protein